MKWIVTLLLGQLFLFLFPTFGRATTYEVYGTSGSDTFTLALFGTIFVTRNGVLELNLDSSKCDSSANTVIKLYGFDGADDFTVSIPDSCDISCKVYGGSGGDVFDVVGCDGIALYGDDGKDKFYLGSSSNYFNGEAYGGNQNDEFHDYFLQYAYLSGGNGNDAFSGNIRDYALIYGGESEDYFFGGPSETEGQGVYVTNDDTGPYSGDEFYYGHFDTIYCDSTDQVFGLAVVHGNVFGDCIN
ncbi:MAG TPA: hypothetical protein VJR29_13870 [bacterium]|nr:hypothetical protein [bacterium]